MDRPKSVKKSGRKSKDNFKRPKGNSGQRTGGKSGGGRKRRWGIW